jgi:hypothetical protein
LKEPKHYWQIRKYSTGTGTILNVKSTGTDYYSVKTKKGTGTNLTSQLNYKLPVPTLKISNYFGASKRLFTGTGTLITGTLFE